MLELIIAMGISAIAFVGIYQVFSSWIVASLETESHQYAIQIAKDKMEEMEARTFTTVTAEARAAVSSFPAFDRDVLITSTTDIKTVEVEVFWQNKEKPKSVLFHTERINWQ